VTLRIPRWLICDNWLVEQFYFVLSHNMTICVSFKKINRPLLISAIFFLLNSQSVFSLSPYQHRPVLSEHRLRNIYNLYPSTSFFLKATDKEDGNKLKLNDVVLKNVKYLLCHPLKVFMSQLERHPLATNSLSAGVVTCLGDILSQYITSNIASTQLVINWTRCKTFFLSGTLFVGPYVYLWYQYLWKYGRWLEARFKISGVRKTIAQLTIDQTFGVAFFYPAFFYAYEIFEAICEMRVPSIGAATLAMQDRIFNVLIMNYRIWPLSNFINFTFIPVKWRVIFTKFVSVLWNVYFCAKVAQW